MTTNKSSKNRDIMSHQPGGSGRQTGGWMVREKMPPPLWVDAIKGGYSLWADDIKSRILHLLGSLGEGWPRKGVALERDGLRGGW